MVRSTVGKVMWIGRATVFLVGLAVILALVLGVASTALGADGKPSLVGQLQRSHEGEHARQEWRRAGAEPQGG